jgi:hypothetical protein
MVGLKCSSAYLPETLLYPSRPGNTTFHWTDEGPTWQRWGEGHETWREAEFISELPEAGRMPVSARSYFFFGVNRGSVQVSNTSVPFDEFWISIGAITTLTLAGFIPAVFILKRAKRLRSRILEGRCLACGYDLRASPGRCPECGAVAEGDRS